MKPAPGRQAAPDRGDEAKSLWVKGTFSAITGRYDFLNRLLSLRRDVAWRRTAARLMRLPPGGLLLDAATGTADLGMEALRLHPGTRAVGLDFTEEMLVAARAKTGAERGKVLELVAGDALALPFPDGRFAVTAMAFGIRNIHDRLAALREMARVTAPGGQVMILEMAMPVRQMVRRPYLVYLRHVLPRLGGLISGHGEAYRYLADSIQAFPPPGEFCGLMTAAGLTGVAWRPLTLGTAYLFTASSPVRPR